MDYILVLKSTPRGEAHQHEPSIVSGVYLALGGVDQCSNVAGNWEAVPVPQAEGVPAPAGKEPTLSIDMMMCMSGRSNQLDFFPSDRVIWSAVAALL
ncbi:hypothetical protein L1987_16360 [Smallanthus sonchifolius]|uniref:Uncharacterized protein n=1 Tax=Smallanthus sonchifolius TaxID=185202 RepID=A0ACB9JBM0_9ASTR|nr:hypothetical protein L1987_16360 [Smallanthus sonchifolius]